MLLFTLLLSLPSHSANTSDALVFRREVSSHGSFEQNALIFGEKNIRLIQNSNRICGAQVEARLGQFTRKIEDADATTRNFFTEIKNKFVVSKKNATSKLTGATYWIGKNAIQPKEEVTSSFDSELDDVCRDRDRWYAIEGSWIRLIKKESKLVVAIITRKKGETISRSFPATDYCRHEEDAKSDHWKCSLPNMGIALLKPPLGG